MRICISDGKHYDVLILLGILLAATIFQARANSLTDLEIDEQLSKLNKPAVKTIVTEDDVVDCVDIYKQPAFDHPLLKDHKIETNPTFHGSIEKNTLNDSTEMFEQPWQKHGSCPEGTIPIKRVQRSDLLRARSARNYGRNDDIYQDCTIISAIAETVNPIKYKGVKADISVWAPNVIGDDWSSASLGLKHDGDESFLRVGWMVYPKLFADYKTRLAVQWRNASAQTGCINLLCPGFVQTSTSIALGSLITPLSEYKIKDIHVLNAMGMDDKKKLWVTVADNLLGYFPPELLPALSATKANWGGTVCRRKRESDATEMGSGHFADDGWLRAALIRNMMVLESNFNNYGAASELRAVSDAPDCYTVDYTIGKFDPSDTGPAIYFGGPGWNCSSSSL